MPECYEIQVIAPNGHEARYETDSLAIATGVYKKFVEHLPTCEAHLHDLENSETLYSHVPEEML